MTDNKPEVLAIIPARGGSKGIPRKNIADLCGKPLIAYTIEVALQSKLISRVVVSTEDEEIAEISKEFGAEVPFLRPTDISGDNACIGDCVRYTRNKLKQDEGYAPEAMITLYPTHPFRTPQLVDTLVHKATTGYKFAKTVKAVTVSPEKFFILDGQNILHPLRPVGLGQNHSENSFVKTQGLGAVFNLRQTSLPFNTYLHRLLDPISLIDIDLPKDLSLAREVIKAGLFNFRLRLQ